MNFTSAVRTDTLPALGTVLVPGAFALSPYAACLLLVRPEVRWFATQHEPSFLGIAVLAVVAAGFLIESVGSYVEDHVLDRWHRDRNAMLDEWTRYLQIAWKVEPIGQRYLRRLLVVFKFELNMSVASAFSLAGVLVLWQWGFVSSGTMGMLALFIAALSVYFCRAATDSSRLLARVRRLLLEASAAQLRAEQLDANSVDTGV